jgi:2-hydroxychromene-2-carboxylate isomerase
MSEPAASTQPYIFYGDLNCPFCHAQNERLIELGAENKVEWRGIRHMPALPVPAKTTGTDRVELHREVVTVRQREPGLHITLPQARPNSEKATLLVAAARRVDREGAAKLKTLLYRALWVHGRDISDAAVLDELRKVAGLPEHLCVNDEDRRAADGWQKEWEGGKFERRIPVLVSPRGGVHLGLGDRGRVDLFLRSGMLSSQGNDVCK